MPAMDDTLGVHNYHIRVHSNRHLLNNALSRSAACWELRHFISVQHSPGDLLHVHSCPVQSFALLKGGPFSADAVRYRLGAVTVKVG